MFPDSVVRPSEASAYVGRQMWASIVSALMVHVPILGIVFAILWGPLREILASALALPLAILVRGGPSAPFVLTPLQIAVEVLMFIIRLFMSLVFIRRNFIKNRRVLRTVRYPC